MDDARRSRQEIGRLASEVVPALIARLGASSLGELEVREDGWRVRVRRNGGAPVAPAESEPSRKRRPKRAESGPDPDRADARAVGPGRERAVDRSRMATAPAVGYYLPAADLATGTQVRSGDVLGHVDVLGVRQEIVAPIDGVVSRLLAQPGEAVEYGQELVQVQPVPRGDVVTRTESDR